PPLDREAEHRDRSRGALRVDDANLVAAELLGGGRRALERARKRRRDVQRVDALVTGELLVGGEEVARRRLRRGRELLGGAQAGIELGRRELHVILVALVAEADVERDDA